MILKMAVTITITAGTTKCVCFAKPIIKDPLIDFENISIRADRFFVTCDCVPVDSGFDSPDLNSVDRNCVLEVGVAWKPRDDGRG